MAVAASYASAATISPASSDFGRVLIGHTTAPRTFTFTKGSKSQFKIEGDGPTFVINDVGSGFSQTASSQVAPNCPAYLTAARPSCTIDAYFSPNTPGPNRGVVFANYLSTEPVAQLTGIGMLPSSSYFCQTRNGHPVHKKLWKYCQKKKKRRK
jgi:hypothetical protein